jgi:hypothetical protein
LFGGLLLLLFLRRLLNLFHFIFVSHGKHSSNVSQPPTPAGSASAGGDPP